MASKKQIIQKSTKDLILEKLNSVKRDGMKELISFIEDSGFFTAPAATKHHSNYEGGLAQHSWNVYIHFVKNIEKLKIKLSDDSIILCSLLHDLCKVDMFEYDYAKKIFIVNDKFPIGHGGKSIFLAERFIRLTNEETCIIRWHMGKFDLSPQTYKSYATALKMYPAVSALHRADVYCAVILEKRRNKK